jgi:hypothetical protein
MSDWSTLVKKALLELGADKQFVPGAKLKQVLAKSGENPHELDEFLDTTAQRFSDLLESIDGIKVQKRGSSDMLVGFPGANWPPPTVTSRAPIPKMQMRDDVYLALTKITALGYYYFPKTDQFVEGPRTDSGEGVPLPKVVFADLINERKVFADQVVDREKAAELVNALEQTASPLVSFQNAVSRLNLGSEWHVFKFGSMRAKLEKWASDHGLPIMPSWYDSSSSSENRGPKEVLVRLADHMTDDEIRQLNVPFRAVEALFNSMNRKYSG